MQKADCRVESYSRFSMVWGSVALTPTFSLFKDQLNMRIRFLLLCNKSPQFSGLKQHPLIISQFLQVRSLGTELQVPCSRSTRMKAKCHPGLHSHLGLGSSSKLTSCWQNLFPCECRIEVLIFLLAVSQGPLPGAGDFQSFLSCGPHRQFTTWMCFSSKQAKVSLTSFSPTTRENSMLRKGLCNQVRLP